MSETPLDCEMFDRHLSESRAGREDAAGWAQHLEVCEDCRRQWHIHRFLEATFEPVPAPRLSPSFDAVLRRELEASLKVKPLEGWRRFALVGYIGAALLGLERLFHYAPIPALDLSAPWVPILVIASIPLSFPLAIFLGC